MHAFLLPLLALLSALAAPAAHAEARASARLANFGYALTDLDPGDGIAPALELNLASGTSFLAASALRLHNGWPQEPPVEVQDIKAVPTILATAQAGAALAHAGASARMGGDAAAHGFGIEAQGQASAGPDPSRSHDFHVLAQAAWPDWNGVDLVLSPYTRLDWSGHVSLAVSVAGQLPARRTEYASAAFKAGLLDAADTSLIGEFTDVDLFVGSFEPGGVSARRQQFAFQLAWVNDSAEAATAKLVLSMGIFGSNAPIPEPATWALLAGGLGVVGLAARRRAPVRATASQTSGRTA